MSDTLNIGGLKVGPCMVRGYIERIAELEQELAIGVNVIRDYEERIAELESDNRRMRKVMQRYIDCQDSAKNNWVLDFLQVLEEEK